MGLESEDPGSRRKRDARRAGMGFGAGLALILLGAAAIRLAYLQQTLTDPLLRDLLILDSRSYEQLAGRIGGGDWSAGNDVFTLGPLYPYFMALLRTLFGEGTGPVYASQQLLGLGSVALTAWIARRCFGTGAAWIAAGLIALHGALALLEVKVMASTLAVFGSLTSLALLLLARERRWRALALLPGLALGLTCLARPNTLLFAPVAALWLVWDGGARREGAGRFPPERIAASVALTVGLILAIAPATLRNHAVTGEWVLISAQGGLTFYQANNPAAQGLYTRLPGFRGTPADLQRQARARAERERGRPLGAVEVSRYWTGQALAWLAAHPLDAARLVGWKLHYWLGSDELSTEYVLPVERDLTPRLRWLPVPFGVILALAAWGLFSAGARRPERVLLSGFVAVNLLSVLLFYFSSRYRLPAVPILAVFAGGGAVAAVRCFRESRGRFAAGLAATLLLAGYSLHSWTDHLRSQAGEQLYNYGRVYHQRGLWPAAIAKYQAALPYFPGRPSLHFDLAVALERSGEREQALRELERTLELAPTYPHAEPLRRKLAGELR